MNRKSARAGSAEMWVERSSVRLFARPCLALLLILPLLSIALRAQTPGATTAPTRTHEYLWYEAENMRGFSVTPQHEPVINASWQNPSRASTPGWGINGPGVSAEWSQGGESEWNSAAASADETRAVIYQEVEISRAGDYRVWVRYADWAGLSESFTLKITQEGREVFSQEFGARDSLDPHDEVSMYWGWAFTWAGATAKLSKGPARVSLEVSKTAEARRHVDCLLLTDDPAFVPEGRRKPDFAAARYLREWSKQRPALTPLINNATPAELPVLWRRPSLAGRDFLVPWNIAPEFWKLYESAPPAERPLYPFNAEPLEEFVKSYKGVRDVPIFGSKQVVPAFHINELPLNLKEGSPFLRYIRETRQPFAVNINYGAVQWSEAEAQAAWKLLNTELREQFIGWISGESIGHVWGDAATELKLNPQMTRRQLLQGYREFYNRALTRKWDNLFHTPGAGPMWEKLIAAQSTSSTAYAHALGEWGTRLLGIETAAVQPVTAMRMAFTRGAARQFGGGFLYYHAPNFGDTATVFVKTMSYGGPDNFFHTRYGASMGPSLTWYRKSYILYYMGGASAIYLEQGFDQFFKPGPGEHPFQLNPLGRITDEFLRLTERHPDRGTPYTPVAFLLDPAHGWDMTDYPHWPFGISQVDRGDRALRELFGAAYYPAAVTEGEPATADRQAFVSSVFGDIFDVLVASDARPQAVDAYRAVVAGGRIEWSPAWARRLEEYVRKGGVVVINAAQVKGLSEEFTGVHLTGEKAEGEDARCLSPNETGTDLRGQVFRYERAEPRKGAQVLIQTQGGDPLVTVNKLGEGSVIFCTLPYLLGEDERLTPFAAHLLAHLFAEASPVRVTGEVEYMVNRNGRGWVVTLLNDRGVLKPQQGLAQVDRGATVDVTLSPRSGTVTQASEWLTERRLEVSGEGGKGSVRLSLPAGGIAVVELLTGGR